MNPSESSRALAHRLWDLCDRPDTHWQTNVDAMAKLIEETFYKDKKEPRPVIDYKHHLGSDVIVSEGHDGRAGLPISAPFEIRNICPSFHSLRWIKTSHSFRLQQTRYFADPINAWEWVDVPCFMP